MKMSVLANISCACRKNLSLALRSMNTRSIFDSREKKIQRLKEMQAIMKVLINCKLTKYPNKFRGFLYINLQCNDDVPIYLKRGTRDKVLFGITVFGTFFGAVQSIAFIWQEAQK